ncbi:MAG: ABC transporter ATP-binding protein [Christensenellaceae bacterium]|jgi:ABC-2 type transport system ATP-binding protein|nr:ABC transporter ATP-binding protein [Christensenellaceae bacterium]
MIEISNLTKTYANSQKKAVNNISFTVSDGEIFGFLGPNGAGKSTTIKCITGILGYDSGSILINGMNLKDDPIATKKKIGYVPDEHIIYDALTCFQYLNFICNVFEIDESKRLDKINKYATDFEMDDKLGMRIAALSHGMKQKLSIIAALIHDPEVFILDEPMTGLDPKSSFKLKLIMNEYVSQGKTVFFSSHVLDVVEKICTEIAIIDKGRLITICDLKDLEARSDLTLENLFLNLTSESELKI